MKDIANKLVLITGGASGMGRIWAKHFLKDGAKVILWDVNEKALFEAKEQFSQNGFTVITQKVDITDEHLVLKTKKDINSNFGNVDILVNNAGVVFGSELTKDDYKKIKLTVDINTTGMIFLTKIFLEDMASKKEAHIINISSASGFIGVPFMSTYTATKWAVIGFTESLRLELKELGLKNIRLTLLCPGYVNTGMFAGVKQPFLMPLLDQEKLIEKSYKLFKNNKYLIQEPFIVKFTPFMKWVFPQWLFDWLLKVLGYSKSMKEWKGKK